MGPSAQQPLSIRSKRRRQKSPAPRMPGALHKATGNSSSNCDQATTTTTPAVPGPRPSAVEARQDKKPSSAAQQPTLRGRNTQYPVSQLLPPGIKSTEARSYYFLKRPAASTGWIQGVCREVLEWLATHDNVMPTKYRQPTEDQREEVRLAGRFQTACCRKHISYKDRQSPKATKK